MAIKWNVFIKSKLSLLTNILDFYYYLTLQVPTRITILVVFHGEERRSHRVAKKSGLTK